VETTGCPIRVSIKQLISVEDDGRGDEVRLAVEDLVRDKPGDLKWTVDPVEANTDFREIVFGDAEYFVSNRLSELESYENSHYRDSAPAYESTVVWPIRKIYEDEDDFIGLEVTDDGDFLGFLCLDSTSPDAFSVHDEQLVGVLAEALYIPFRLWNFDEYAARNEDVADAESGAGGTGHPVM
jgi:hypothetical protein